MTGVVLFEHSPYRTTAPWVQLQVPLAEAGAAVEFMEMQDLKEDPASIEDQIAHLQRRVLIARWFVLAQSTSLVLLAIVFGLVVLYGMIGFPTETYEDYLDESKVQRVAPPDPALVVVSGFLFVLCVISAAIFVSVFLVARRSPFPALKTALYTFYVIAAGQFLMSLGSPADVLRLLLGVVMFAAAVTRGIEAAQLAKELHVAGADGGV